jgi:fatty aldehyde-generating acyl-ACP reductase
VQYIGLGAMTSSLSRGGKDVIENIPGVFVTTGRTYTVKNITDYIFYCLNLFNLKKEDVCVGVVGAAGGIGSGVVIMLSTAGFKNFVLIDLERKLENIKHKIFHFEKDDPKINIKISHQVSLVKICDIVIAATNAPEVVIKSEDVNPGTIIINDAQPSDVSPEIIKNRKDVLVIEGGVLFAPEINCHFNFGLSHKNEIFSCLAETLLLAYKDEKRHYSIEDLNLDFLHELSHSARKLRFSINKLQNSQGYISDDFIKNFSYNLMVRKSQKDSWIQ